MSETYMIFKANELKLVSFKCSCGTGVTMDVTGHHIPTQQDAPKCPACRAPLTELVEAFNAYKIFYDLVKDDNRLSLRGSTIVG